MPITKLESDTVFNGANAARLVIDQLYPLLRKLNIIYDSGGGVKSTLDQAKLDGVPLLSGITKAQVDDGMYALTATLKGAIENAYAQIAELAARSQ